MLQSMVARKNDLLFVEPVMLRSMVMWAPTSCGAGMTDLLGGEGAGEGGEELNEKPGTIRSTASRATVTTVMAWMSLTALFR